MARHIEKIAFDARSARAVDENGFLHVTGCHITKATVNPYWGSEIPGWEDAGLDPQTIYYGYRDPEELQKSLPTWRGLPLHLMHHMDSAEDPQKSTRVGSIGTDVTWNAPYVDASLTVWDQTAIDNIRDDSFRELSCAYRYDPDFTSGTVEGIKYDFVMRNIRGNHVALVDEGRAGPDVVVADQNIKPKGGHMPIKKTGRKGMAQDADPAIEKQEVDLAQAIIDLHKIDPNTGEIVDITEDEDKAEELRSVVSDIAEKLPPEDMAKLSEALAGLAFAESPASEEQKEEGASDEEEPDTPANEKDEAPEGAADEDDEATRAAITDCGLDADDPAVVAAFKAGVTFGEEKESSSDESTGEDEDEGAPQEEPEVPAAADRRMKRSSRRTMAMDAATIAHKAASVARAQMRALYRAVDVCRPIAGSLDPMAFDSATDVYGAALRLAGVDTRKYSRSAWRGMVDVLLRQKGGSPAAMDAAPLPRKRLDGRLSGLNRIKLGD